MFKNKKKMILFKLKGRYIYKHVQEQKRNDLDRIERAGERERESEREEMAIQPGKIDTGNFKE